LGSPCMVALRFSKAKGGLKLYLERF